MYLGYQGNKIKFYTEEELSVELYNLDRSVYTENEYVLDGAEYVLKDEEWEEKKRQQEQERINGLNLTKADFWIALLDRDITKDMVKGKINLIPDEKLKAKTLIRLDDADHFWRGDPSMDVIGAMFDITPQDLNYLFENGELPKE